MIILEKIKKLEISTKIAKLPFLRQNDKITYRFIPSFCIMDKSSSMSCSMKAFKRTFISFDCFETFKNVFGTHRCSWAGGVLQ
jgi:hypothetical protein